MYARNWNDPRDSPGVVFSGRFVVGPLSIKRLFIMPLTVSFEKSLIKDTMYAGSTNSEQT